MFSVECGSEIFKSKMGISNRHYRFLYFKLRLGNGVLFLNPSDCHTCSQNTSHDSIWNDFRPFSLYISTLSSTCENYPFVSMCKLAHRLLYFKFTWSYLSTCWESMATFLCFFSLEFICYSCESFHSCRNQKQIDCLNHK